MTKNNKMVSALIAGGLYLGVVMSISYWLSFFVFPVHSMFIGLLTGCFMAISLLIFIVKLDDWLEEKKHD